MNKRISIAPVRPLRQRLIDDMNMRHFLQSFYLLKTQGFREGLAAFMERHVPDFKGQSRLALLTTAEEAR